MVIGGKEESEAKRKAEQYKQDIERTFSHNKRYARDLFENSGQHIVRNILKVR